MRVPERRVARSRRRDITGKITPKQYLKRDAGSTQNHRAFITAQPACEGKQGVKLAQSVQRG
jgi:hypothetical protein